MLWSVDGLFSAVDFSPDGDLLVTGAPDGSITALAGKRWCGPG